MASQVPCVNRLVGSLPKVGIRPAIDGRRGGVLESLEGQTMGMAKAVAKLISESLRHPCGAPVECVISDTCIGGVAEAAQTAAKFEREGVGVSLTVSPCWCYGSETMDMDPLIPKAVWGFNGTERPGAVYLAAVLAGHNQKGLPAFSIYGRDVQDKGQINEVPADVRQKILSFVRAGLAVATMRGKSYLSLGNVSMGIAGSLVNHDFFERYLGMRVETVESVEFVRRIEQKIYDEAEYQRAAAWAKANCKEGDDRNSKKLTPEQKARVWEWSIKMAMIGRDLMVGNPRLAEMGFVEESMGHNAIAAGFQGQRQWTDTYPNGDFMEAILCSSFDWNGIRAPYVMATENDCLNGTVMLFGNLLTGTAQVFADVRTYWSPAAIKRVTGYDVTGPAAHGLIHLINSGAAALDGAGCQQIGGQPAMKPFWEISEKEAKACLDATTWCPAILEYFRGSGLSSHFVSRGGMPVTLSRVNLIRGQGPVLQIAEGWTFELPEKAHNTLDSRTDPTWPTTWFAPRCSGSGVFKDGYTVMNAWGANHGAFSYGHVGADLITLAAMLRIPVCMHNVPEENVFRPSVWAGFGTADLEGADFRACANFGPVYGR
ncbi:MAG: L-fucose isomerase [Thermoguttaceae bacterium]